MGGVNGSHVRIFTPLKILDSGLQNAVVTHHVVAMQTSCEHRLGRTFASKRHSRYRVTRHGIARGSRQWRISILLYLYLVLLMSKGLIQTVPEFESPSQCAEGFETSSCHELRHCRHIRC